MIPTIHKNEKVNAAYLMLVEVATNELLKGNTQIHSILGALEAVRTCNITEDLVDGLNLTERSYLPHQKINAIKELRARTGLLLKDACEVVNTYMAKHFPPVAPSSY